MTKFRNFAEVTHEMLLDRVAQAIVDGLKLKTTVGESERALARSALTAAVLCQDQMVEEACRLLEVGQEKEGWQAKAVADGAIVNASGLTEEQRRV